MTNTFGQLIRQARKAQQLSQRELAQLVEVNYTYLSKLENDHAGTPPSEEVIGRLADCLGLDAETLIYLAGRITPADQKIFAEFIKENYEQMPVLFRKMKKNPKFAQKLLQEAKEEE